MLKKIIRLDHFVHSKINFYRVLTVHEKTRIEPFHCHADAFPEAKYYWHFETGNRTTIGTELEFRHPLRRDQVGL